MRNASGVLVFAAMAGCAPHRKIPIFVAPASVEAERESLLAGKTVRIMVSGGESIDVRAEQTVNLYRGSVLMGSVQLERALRACSSSSSSTISATVAGDMHDINNDKLGSFCGMPGVSRLQVGTWESKERDWRAVHLGLALGGLVAVGGVGACAGFCENRTLQGTSIAIVGVAAVVMFVSLFRELADEDRQ
ncbi:MAG: hypothetical protein KBG15_12660 [Kofleriaceae bacterium]|nr:hypothetical protein [Kofleriaceae bacterium]